MTDYSRSVMRCGRKAVEGPYAGSCLFGTGINDGAGSIENGSAVFVKMYGAAKVVGESCNALQGVVKVWVVEHVN